LYTSHGFYAGPTESLVQLQHQISLCRFHGFLSLFYERLLVCFLLSQVAFFLPGYLARLPNIFTVLALAVQAKGKARPAISFFLTHPLLGSNSFLKIPPPFSF